MVNEAGLWLLGSVALGLALAGALIWWIEHRTIAPIVNPDPDDPFKITRWGPGA